MSLLLTSNEGWIISHLEYINTLYNNVQDNVNNTSYQLKFDEKIFHITSPFLRHNQVPKISEGTLQIVGNKKSKKRKKPNSLTTTSTEVEFVHRTLDKILSEATDKGLFLDVPAVDYNKEARSASEAFYTDNYDEPIQNFNGKNQSDHAIVSDFKTTRYVFPENCSFYCYDIKHIAEKLDLRNQYNFILMDPPWWNKFIRRNKDSSYKMMYNVELGKMPIAKLIKPDGIVAIWCTNAPSHYHDVINVILPSWGMRLVAKWFWVTQAGKTICDFHDRPGKLPYELLIFGTPFHNSTTNIPDNKLFVSVPSAIHSHKPPISALKKSTIATEGAINVATLLFALNVSVITHNCGAVGFVTGI